MTLYKSDFEIRYMKEQQMKEYIREAEIDHLVHELKPRRPSFARRLLGLAGRALIGAGKRIEGSPAPQIATQAR